MVGHGNPARATCACRRGRLRARGIRRLLRGRLLRRHALLAARSSRSHAGLANLSGELRRHGQGGRPLGECRPRRTVVRAAAPARRRRPHRLGSAAVRARLPDLAPRRRPRPRRPRAGSIALPLAVLVGSGVALPGFPSVQVRPAGWRRVRLLLLRCASCSRLRFGWAGRSRGLVGAGRPRAPVPFAGVDGRGSEPLLMLVAVSAAWRRRRCSSCSACAHSGAPTIGWPLVWSVPLYPYRALGLPLDPGHRIRFRARDLARRERGHRGFDVPPRALGDGQPRGRPHRLEPVRASGRARAARRRRRGENRNLERRSRPQPLYGARLHGPRHERLRAPRPKQASRELGGRRGALLGLSVAVRLSNAADRSECAVGFVALRDGSANGALARCRRSRLSCRSSSLTGRWATSRCRRARSATTRSALALRAAGVAGLGRCGVSRRSSRSFRSRLSGPSTSPAVGRVPLGVDPGHGALLHALLLHAAPPPVPPRRAAGRVRALGGRSTRAARPRALRLLHASTVDWAA